VGWTGLVDTLVIEHLIGYHRDRGVRRLAPNFPPAAAGAFFQLTLPADGVGIELHVLADGRTRGTVKAAGTSREFSLEKGGCIEF
jgi:hypothetical protein